MNYEVSKLLPTKPKPTCPWCGEALLSDKHIVQRTHAILRCPTCGQYANYSDIASAPALYEAMPPDARTRLTDWIQDRFISTDDREAAAEDTYVLKHRYQVQTDTYLYSGCLNGALLHLGFRPLDTLQTNWRFCMRWRKPGEATADYRAHDAIANIA